MKNKSDVFETFKKWNAMVKTETSLKVKCYDQIMEEST